MVQIYRSKFIDENCCYEQLRLTNSRPRALTFSVSFEFEAHFADIFEVRAPLDRGREASSPLNSP